MLANQAKNLATILSIEGNEEELVQTLKATVFKGNVTDAQMTALLIVASKYKLNPWTKEIFSFPDRNNGIVPVISIDGWVSIINARPELDGIDFVQDEESCTCIIYRKDRGHPIKVTEWLSECKKNDSPAWKSHPKRMMRHRALIQCARVAFGFSGIYDEDEAANIIDTGEKIINPMPNEKPHLSKVEAILNAVKTMQIEDFKSIDAIGLTQEEKAQINAACKARKKEILDSNVVMTQEKTPNWPELIEEAQTQDELTSIFNSMSPADQAKYNGDIDLKMDMLRA